VFLHDLVTGTTTRVSVGSGGSQAGGPSFRPSISGDGTVAAFESDAPLVFADTNQARDVYARNPLS
jgi:hypothetical protein